MASLLLLLSVLQVQLDDLPGMSLVAGKALSSARMSDAVLSQASLTGSQQLPDREDEGKEPGTCGAVCPVTAPLFCTEFLGPRGFWTRRPSHSPRPTPTPEHEWIEERVSWLRAGATSPFRCCQDAPPTAASLVLVAALCVDGMCLPLLGSSQGAS